MLLQILQEKGLKEIFKTKKLGIVTVLTFLFYSKKFTNIDSDFIITYYFTIYSNNMAIHYHKFIGLILVNNYIKTVSRVWWTKNSLLLIF